MVTSELKLLLLLHAATSITSRTSNHAAVVAPSAARKAEDQVAGRPAGPNRRSARSEYR